MATARGKKYIITEGGSWFKSYFSLEGFTVIKNMILKAKYHGYEAVCIVALDNNGATNPNLGFRRFNYNYSTLLETSPYWQDFINLANREGKKYQSEIIISEEDMELKLLGLAYTKTGQQVKWLQDILLNDYKVPNPGGIDGKLGSMTDKQIRDYQEEKELKVDGIVGEQTTMKLINESSDPKKWIINLQIYMAYE